MTTIREELLKKYGQYHKIENMEDGCIADEFVYEIRQIIIKKLDERINELKPYTIGYRGKTALEQFKRELEK